MRKLMILVFVVSAVFVLPALAAKPVPPSPIMVGAWGVAFNPNPNYPSDEPGCAHEDFHQVGNWGGTLLPGEAFEVTVLACDYWVYCGYQCTAPACDPPVLYYTTECSAGGPDGVGIMYMVEYSSEHNLDIYAIRPDGTRHDPHVEVIGYSNNKKVTYYRATGCFTRYYSIATNTYSSDWGPPVQAGTYRFVVTNVGGVMPSDIGELIQVRMADPAWQLNVCPVEDQRLVP